MYQIAYIGRWETLPETAAAICDHDTSKLEALLQGDLNLDVPIQLSEYIKLMPLEIAVFRNDVPMIHFLLEHGADPGLAEEQPLLLTAARCCGPEVVALFAEQAAILSPKQKERAFQEVRWGKRPENIQVLEQAGITVNKFGGEAFRAAVSEGNTKLAQLLLEKGADINYHKPDMVFPNASTAVTEAARHKNLPMVRWLIEQGADITIADKYGDRPYTVAVQNKNQELADYLKALEPEEWHNEQEKVRQLMPYKLPAKLVEYLKTGPLRLEFPDQEWVKWAELYSFMDVQEMTWKRKKLLSLMAAMNNYSDYLLLWNPRDKKLWYLIGFSYKHQRMAHFRVDRLSGIKILPSGFTPDEGFDVAGYTNKIVDMFAADRTISVELLCENKLMKTIIDHYGESVPTRPYDEEHFTANIEVDPSSTFYGWVFKFMGGIQIIAPQECVEEMKRIARSFL